MLSLLTAVEEFHGKNFSFSRFFLAFGDLREIPDSESASLVEYVQTDEESGF